MARSFKKGSRVQFRTQRGRTGRGTVTAVRTYSRGDWYEVQPTGTQEIIKVRLAGLS